MNSRNEPFASAFQRSVEDLFSQLWTEPKRQSFAPLVDVDETADSFVVRVELPGIDAAEVELTVESDSLAIKGEKKLLDVEEGHSYIHERRHGKFSRTITFPSVISTDDVVALANKGVLQITVKKAQASKRRRVDIEVD